MKIESSSILMSAQSSSVTQYSKEESLKSWTGNVRPDFEGMNQDSPKAPDTSQVTLDLSDEAKALLAKKKASARSVDDGESTLNLNDIEEAKIKMLEDFIREITGKRIKLRIPDKIRLDGDRTIIGLNGRELQLQPLPRQGWGLEYEYHEASYERQNMSFSSEGTIKTTDGREIDFSLQLNMSSEFYSRTDISIRAGDAARIDPLVINFDGKAAGLTDTKFSFDLDNDGSKDQISFVRPGSGFLSLDLNNDGRINNGSELFGPASGNGFSELAAYDKDGNNWIDENDEIFDKLRIWTKDEYGNDKLFALGGKGIGAIYLGNVDTAFSMKNSSNEVLGDVRKSGIFVKENGSVGTIQHIDLAV